MNVDKFGPRHAHDEEASGCRPLRNRVEQVDQGGLCPLDVVQDDHDRFAGRKVLKEPADGPGNLGQRAYVAPKPDERCQARHDLFAIRCTPEELRERRFRGRFDRWIDAGGITHEVMDRPVGDAFAVEAPAADHRR